MVDFSIIVFFLLSGVISYFYGFVRELFSFWHWLLSLIIALIFFEEFAGLLTMLPPKFGDLRLGISLIGLFFTSFLLFEWLNYLFLNSIGRTQLSVYDRILAILLGMARNSVIVIFLLVLAGLTHLPSTAWWQKSVTIQTMKPVVVELRYHWGRGVAQYFAFDPPPKHQ